MVRLITVFGLVLLTACSQTPGDTSTTTTTLSDADILIAIGSGDEIWIREDMPYQLRGVVPIDQNSPSSIDASIVVDSADIPDVELPSVFPANLMRPVYCGGHMEGGVIKESSCFISTPAPPNWIQVDGEIAVGNRDESIKGHVLCLSFVTDGGVPNAVCNRYDYL